MWFWPLFLIAILAVTNRRWKQNGHSWLLKACYTVIAFTNIVHLVLHTCCMILENQTFKLWHIIYHERPLGAGNWKIYAISVSYYS